MRHIPATMNHPIISIQNLSTTYDTGFQALQSINLEIRHDEIFPLI